MDFRVTCPALEQLHQLVLRAEGDAERELARAMEQAVMVVEREVVLRTPTNKIRTGGRLRNAIGSTVQHVGSFIRGIVAVAHVPYALVVETGSKPHIIRAKPGKFLAFSPVAGFRVRFQGGQALRGRALFRVQLFRSGEIGGGATIQGMRFDQDPGQMAFARTGRRGEFRVVRRMDRRERAGGDLLGGLTTRQGPGTLLFRKQVHHPGTTGFHMFRDGYAAAAPQVRVIFGQALQRLVQRLKG